MPTFIAATIAWGSVVLGVAVVVLVVALVIAALRFGR